MRGASLAAPVASAGADGQTYRLGVFNTVYMSAVCAFSRAAYDWLCLSSRCMDYTTSGSAREEPLSEYSRSLSLRMKLRLA